MPESLLKKRLWHRSFPVNFVKFLRSPFFTEHLQWLCFWRILTLSRLFKLQQRKERDHPLSLCLTTFLAHSQTFRCLIRSFASFCIWNIHLTFLIVMTRLLLVTITPHLEISIWLNFTLTHQFKLGGVVF